MTPWKMCITKNGIFYSHFYLDFVFVFVFYQHDLFVKNTITSSFLNHLNNYTPLENVCFNLGYNQNHPVAFVMLHFFFLAYERGMWCTRTNLRVLSTNCTAYFTRLSALNVFNLEITLNVLRLLIK